MAQGRSTTTHAFVAPERRRIGYVPQEGALFPHLSVEANVGFGLTRAERRGAAVAELLEMVGISAACAAPARISFPAASVSARRSLARLRCDPSCCCWTSPSPRWTRRCGRGARGGSALLRQQGITTVLVTHDQEEALSLADSVAVLRDGRIVQAGSPDDLYNQPADARLARFLGAANLIDAALQDGVAKTPLGALAVRGGAPPGEVQGVVLLRPEQLQVRPRNAHEPDAGGAPSLAGRVEQCRYYGHDAVMSVVVDAHAGLSARSLLVRVGGEHALPAGTEVSVSASGSATLLADEAAPEPGER